MTLPKGSRGLPVMPLPMTAEKLLIPNTVGVIRERAAPEAAQRLLEYLESPAVASAIGSGKRPARPFLGEVSTPTLKVNWDALLRDLEATTAKLNEIFLR